MGFPAGRKGFRLAAIASTWDQPSQSYTSTIRANLLIQHELDREYFELLKAKKSEIEAEFGEPLVWDPDSGRRCKVFVSKPADVEDEDDWPAQHAWLKEKLERLARVLGPHLRSLPDPGQLSRDLAESSEDAAEE